MVCYIYKDCTCGNCSDSSCDIVKGVLNDEWQSMIALRVVHRTHGEGTIIHICSVYKKVWIHFDLKGSKLYSLDHFLKSKDFIFKVNDEEDDLPF